MACGSERRERRRVAPLKGAREGEEMVVVVVKVGEDAGRREAGQGRVRDEEGRRGGWY